MTHLLLHLAFINVSDTPRPSRQRAAEVSHSPAPRTQTSFSPGSPAACTHTPVTPPESAASCFPPGSLPVEVENTHTHTHRDDYRDGRMHGSREDT